MKFSNSLLSSVILSISAINAASVQSSIADCATTKTTTEYSITNIPLVGAITSVSSSSSTTSSTPITTSSSSTETTEATTEETAAGQQATETTSSSTTEPTTSTTSTSSTSTTSTSSTTSTTSTSSTTSTTSTSSTSTTSTTSTSSTATPTATSTPFSFEAVYLAKHNELRSLMEDTGPLTWNDQIAQLTQQAADDWQCDGVFRHNNFELNGEDLGENLAYGYNFENAGAVEGWFNEIRYYNYSDPKFDASTGHFTQLVWKDTTQVGCGYKNCGTPYGYYIVCDYLPAGNVDLQGDTSYFYRLNVLEPKDSATLNGI